MPTISAPLRNRRNRRKGSNPTPPPGDKQPSYVVVHASERELPPPDPATLPEALRYQREKCYAWAMASRFGEWLILLAARERVPLDNCLGQIERLTLFVEAFLLVAATWPHLCPQEIADDDEPDPWAPTTEADALEAGLTIRKPQRYVPVPMLPGCHGTDNGVQCDRLRRYGELFCPHHRRKELQRLRDSRG